MNQKDELLSTLKRLKMPGIGQNLDLRLADARDSNLTHLDFISLLIQDEMVSRENNNFEKRLRCAGFSSISNFESFNFNFNAQVFAPTQIRNLATCGFVLNSENLVLCGPPGIGKSHIAQAIGYEACKRQMDVVFGKVSKLIEDILDPLYPKRSARLVKNIMKCHLLILDDFAFRKYSQKESEVLYSICDSRLGKRSIVITSNRPPEDWYSVFPDPVIGGAILDRLVSGAIKIISTGGESYRKERKSINKQP
jgi:DNA replication protein DnaC